jgi:hypothetical protein
MPRQIGWSQEATLLYYISGQVGRVAQILASAVSSSGVSSFNTRTGDITLLSADVTGALGYTPANGNIYSGDGSLTGVRTVTTGPYAIAFNATQPLANYTFTVGVPPGVGGSWPATFVRAGEFNISATSSAEPENSRYWGRNQTTARKTLYVNQSYADVTAETIGGSVSLNNQIFKTSRGSQLDISTTVDTLSALYGVRSLVGHPYTGASATTAQIYTQNVTALAGEITNSVGNMVNVNGLQITLQQTTGTTAQNSTITNFYGIRLGTFTIGTTTVGGPTATITNFYGLYIDGPTVRTTGTVTNRWGIYAGDAAMTHYINGNVVIGTATLSGYKLDVNGTLRASQFYLSALNSTPASAAATGTLGEIRIDANYIYVCVATNTWKRASIATW